MMDCSDLENSYYNHIYDLYEEDRHSINMGSDIIQEIETCEFEYYFESYSENDSRFQVLISSKKLDLEEENELQCIIEDSKEEFYNEMSSIDEQIETILQCLKKINLCVEFDCKYTFQSLYSNMPAFVTNIIINPFWMNPVFVNLLGPHKSVLVNDTVYLFLYEY